MQDVSSKIYIDPTHKGIVYEAEEQFEKSFFEKVYKQADELVKNIVNSRNYTTYNGKLRNKEHIDNVITFFGRRGTGKTSAMLSFMEALENHEKYEDNGWILKWDKNKEYRFICLNWIDASLLEKGEDIFSSILIKMYSEVFSYSRDSFGVGNRLIEDDIKELNRKFEHIYKHFTNVRKENNVANYNRENSLTVLRDLSVSDRIREDFAELVTSYISFMNIINTGKNVRNDKTYLVIAIDDIDLNAENGYEILEQIHRYLMVPGVIVLNAMDYDEMILCCDRRYIENYKEVWQHRKESVKDLFEVQSKNYLEKVLPPYMRIYLPSLKKRDYSSAGNIGIKIDNENHDTIKKGMLYLIWKKTGVFYDAMGKKRHFIEPDTLRDLTGKYIHYYEMDSLDDENDDYLEKYDVNYHKVMDDIIFRMTVETLPPKEKKLFKTWSEERISRRGKMIVEAVLNCSKEEKEEPLGAFSDYRFDVFKEDYKVFSYSYGELLRSIYVMTRQKIFSKELAHVLLAQFTVVLSRAYEHYKKNPEDKKYKEIMDSLMDKSIGGSFAKFIGPSVAAQPFGARRLVKSYSEIAPDEIKVKLYEIDKNDEKWKSSNLEYETSLEFCEKLVENVFMESFFLQMFFLNDFKGNRGFNEKYKLIVEDTDNKITIYLKNDCHFNILNFVNNVYQYEDVMKEIYIAIREAIVEGENVCRQDIKSWAEEMLKKEQNRTCTGGEETQPFVKEFADWGKNKGVFALPTYNLDITYNLIKRLVVENKYDRNAKGKVEEAYGILKDILLEIAEKLRDQDGEYNHLKGISGQISELEDCFRKCPIVRRILADADNYHKPIFFNLYCVTNEDKTINEGESENIAQGGESDSSSKEPGEYAKGITKTL